MHVRRCSLSAGSVVVWVLSEAYWPWAVLPLFAHLHFFPCGFQLISVASAALTPKLEMADTSFCQFYRKCALWFAASLYSPCFGIASQSFLGEKVGDTSCLVLPWSDHFLPKPSYTTCLMTGSLVLRSSNQHLPGVGDFTFSALCKPE